MPHVFNYEKKYEYKDTLGQIHIEYYPMRYINSANTTTPIVSGTWVNYGTGASSKADTNNCLVDRTNGEILYSGHFMTSQISCEPHAYDAGNYYNLPSQLGDAKYNNVCPRGWMVPQNNSSTSYANFLIAYGIDYGSKNKTQPYDAALLNLPLSFLRSGRYDNNSTGNRGGTGYYRMSANQLALRSGDVNVGHNTFPTQGLSVRCIAR